MEFKVDENLPVEVTDLLRQAGYDAVTVLEQHLGGSSDPDVASVCREEGRILITLDTGFAHIRAYSPAECPGLIVLRLHRQDKRHVLQILDRLMPVLPASHLSTFCGLSRRRV